MKAKVRFHLAKGPNYQRWQVKQGSDVTYYDPEDYILEMHNAKLRNQRKTAERILEGENKTVCAWVECDHVTAKPRRQYAAPILGEVLYYNPRRRPHWFNTKREDVDNTTYDMLATFGRLIITPKKQESHVD